MSSPDPALYMQNDHNDEIDLRDLALMLIEGWYWIIGTIVVAVVAAFAYLAITTTTYETRFKAIPSAGANFSGFNLFEDFEITPKDAYRTLGNQLSSYQNFAAFVEEHRDLFDLENGANLSKVFSERFSIGGLNADRDGNLMLSLTYRYPEGEQGPEILNSYVRSTSQDVWITLRNQFDDYNRAQASRLSTDLELQKESLQGAREDRLFALEQAINVARRLEIEKPTTPQQFGRQPNGSEVIYANISGDGALPLYFMGYQTLEADRDVLRSAIDEGLSNSQIRDTQQQLEQRERIATLLDSGRLYGIDEGVEPNHTERVVDVVDYAFPPAEPVKPRKALILAISLALGGILGVMLVFLVRFAASLRGYRQKKARD
ncbi:GNVR domain-containing protein [Halomonas halocynthiae]|uniref:GNVR domain-containing protein n=1 Tax=Halomonas halocynthiae TaxID=176290 RepID=UPI00041E6E1E|nr:GNVR domain-containing protein [Halomonas halocynthiae]